MIKTKIVSCMLAAGLLLATNPHAQAQKGNKKEKKEKEHQEREKDQKEREKYEKEKSKEYKGGEGRIDQVKQRPEGLGGILGKVILPPAGSASPRQLQGVPKGHYPPPGQCRIWYPNRPPGHQPPPTSCGSLRGVRLEQGAFILHGDKAYDAEYDWREEERRRPGSVGRDILDILFPAN